jgi:hypothetical protein
MYKGHKQSKGQGFGIYKGNYNKKYILRRTYTQKKILKKLKRLRIPTKKVLYL